MNQELLDCIRLKLSNSNIALISRRIGMSKMSLYKIRDGEIKSPQRATVERLCLYFLKN